MSAPAAAAAAAAAAASIAHRQVLPSFLHPHHLGADCGPCIREAGQRLAEFLRPQQGRKTVCITGAGISVQSGIPDYRSPGRPPHRPIRHDQFVRSLAARRRYWARSFVGYEQVFQAKPNPAHSMLAAAERHGLLSQIITQNVDGLHLDAGSPSTIELHGSIHHVRCLGCGERKTRAAFQHELATLNPRLPRPSLDPAFYQRMTRPDGDIELSPELYTDFNVPPCTACGGTVKPDVVFFGDNVPLAVAHQAMAAVEQAGAILAVGTSLTVHSVFRFIRYALQRMPPMPVAILNRGPTRADTLAAEHPDRILRIDLPLQPVLEAGVLGAAGPERGSGEQLL